MKEWLLALVSVTGVGAWWTGMLNAYLPGPQRVRLALKNARQGRAEPLEDRFRVVLCWLENDPKGDNTRRVEQAFTRVTGVEQVSSARIVAASGAADDWRKAMQKRARLILDDWSADLAIVGAVKAPQALNLWIVTRSGRGTLERGDQPYRLDQCNSSGGFPR